VGTHRGGHRLGRRVLLILSGPATLTEFAQRLVQMNATLQIQTALNLDGAASSGLMYRSGTSGYREVGNIKTLIGSAILVNPIGNSRLSATSPIGNTLESPQEQLTFSEAPIKIMDDSAVRITDAGLVLRTPIPS